MLNDGLFREAMLKIEKGVCVLDRQLKIRFWNEWLAQKTEIEPQHAEGQPFKEIVGNQIKPYLINRLQRAIETGQPDFMSQSLNRYLIRIPITGNKTFTEMQQKVTLKPITEAGLTQYLVIYIDDVTLEAERIHNLNFIRKNLQKIVSEKTSDLILAKENLEEKVKERTIALEQAKVAAEQASRYKSIFLANMSHEIRTPLNAVTGFSELLSSIVSDDKQKHYLEAIKSAAKSLLLLINDILDLSKIEAGKMEIRRKPLRIRTLLSEIEQIFLVRTSEKDLAFNINIDPDLPEMMLLDDIRLRQVLLNLVGNAFKFTDEGSIDLAISAVPTIQKPQSVHLKIAVTDTGIGIDEKNQEIIFQSFQQQEGQDFDKYGGSGLGLAISKRLVEMMAGEISVTSFPGQGSTFEVSFDNVEVWTAGEQAALEQPLLENTRFERGKVLIADDVRSNLLLLREVLTKTNLDVITAENGEEAVIIARKYQPDLVIIDLRMPIMDGLAATKRLKSSPDTRSIPILALTASASEQKKTALIEAGVDGYLTKPVIIPELLTELKAFFPLMSSGKKMAENLEGPAALETGESFDAGRQEEVLAILQQEIKPALDKLKKVMKLKELRRVYQRIDEIGDAFADPRLKAYADQLKTNDQLFDVKAIYKTIGNFPEMMGLYR